MAWRNLWPEPILIWSCWMLYEIFNSERNSSHLPSSKIHVVRLIRTLYIIQYNIHPPVHQIEVAAAPRNQIRPHDAVLSHYTKQKLVRPLFIAGAQISSVSWCFTTRYYIYEVLNVSLVLVRTINTLLGNLMPEI